MNRLHLVIVFLAVCLSAKKVYGSGIACYQCNIFTHGTQDVCGIKQRNMYNCTSCMKTYVRAYMHDGWRRYRYTDTTAKYCVRFRQDLKAEGCYTTSADAGYVRQCFCYSDWCNAAPSMTSLTHVSALCVLIYRVFVHRLV